MAEFNAGSIAVVFKAQTAELVKGIEESNRHLNQFKKGVDSLGALVAFKAIAGAMVSCVEASSEAAVNVRKLQAVVSDGADVVKFQNLATELSHVSTFTDDAAMSALSLLGKFNLTDQQMATMLPRLADFASFMGTDLPGAADAAGRAIANGAGGLRGLGLAFTAAEKEAFQMASQQERVAILTEKMGEKFAGMAEAVANTGAGAMKQFGNELGELQETIGNLVDAPVATFFQGMTSVVRLVSNVIGNMSDEMRTALAIIGGVVGTFAALTAAAVGVSSALAFFGGLPAILATVASAASTVLLTLGAIVAPLLVMAATVTTLGGMISRIKSGNFNFNESFVDSIKNNFKAGLDEIKGSFKGLFEAPKTDVNNMTEAVKGFDNTLRKVTVKVQALDFSQELAAAQPGAQGNPFEQIGDSLSIDFSKYLDEQGRELTGDALLAAQRTDAVGRAGVSGAAQAGVDSRPLIEAGMADIKNAGNQLVNRMGQTAQTMMSVATKFATGDVVGAVTTLGVDLLTRTKGFAKILEFLEKIMGFLASLLEPVIEAILPLLDIVTMLAPVLNIFTSGLHILAAVLNVVGGVLKWIVKGIGGFWNGLIEILANILGAIPFVGDDIARWLRKSKMDLSDRMEESQEAPAVAAEKVAEALPALADSVGSATDGFKELNDSMRNVPEGFKIAAARFAAIDVGVSAAIPSYTTSLGSSAVASSSSRDRAAAGGAPTINIAKLSVTSDDPNAIAAALTEAAQREAFVRTGKTTTGDSNRQYWGG